MTPIFTEFEQETHEHGMIHECTLFVVTDKGTSIETKGQAILDGVNDKSIKANNIITTQRLFAKRLAIDNNEKT